MISFIVQDLGFASLICPATVKAVKQGTPESLEAEKRGETRHGLAQVELDDGRCLRARLVVGKAFSMKVT